MLFLSDFLRAIKIAANPSEQTKAEVTAKEALSLYYKSIVIPIALVLLAYNLKNYTGSNLILLLTPALLFPALFVLFSIALTVGAKMIMKCPMPFDKTFAAVFMSGAAFVVLSNLLSIISVFLKLGDGVPIAHFLLYSVIAPFWIYFIIAWAFIVLIFSLSNQQKINKSKAILLTLSGLPMLVLLIIIVYALIGFSFGLQ